MTNPFNLSGRVAMVTGANSGIGQGIAIALAAAGADIIVVGRSAPDETGDAVRALGRRFHSIRANLDSTAPIPAIMKDAEKAFGAVDILVNNAGMIGRRAEALDTTEADWDAVMDVNLKTLFFLSQAVAKTMVAAKRPGKIINVASILSFQGGIRVAPYTASKGGLAGVTRILANEWAAKGINVNAIAPGYIETKATTTLQTDPDRNQQILSRIPAGRWGTPEDLGGAAVFLASNAADYVHGTLLTVDGGWMAR